MLKPLSFQPPYWCSQGPTPLCKLLLKTRPRRCVTPESREPVPLASRSSVEKGDGERESKFRTVCVRPGCAEQELQSDGISGVTPRPVAGPGHSARRQGSAPHGASDQRCGERTPVHRPLAGRWTASDAQRSACQLAPTLAWTLTGSIHRFGQRFEFAHRPIPENWSCQDSPAWIAHPA
jgi:hypothetical protein